MSLLFVTPSEPVNFQILLILAYRYILQMPHHKPPPESPVFRLPLSPLAWITHILPILPTHGKTHHAVPLLKLFSDAPFPVPLPSNKYLMSASYIPGTVTDPSGELRSSIRSPWVAWSGPCIFPHPLVTTEFVSLLM